MNRKKRHQVRCLIISSYSSMDRKPATVQIVRGTIDLNGPKRSVEPVDSGSSPDMSAMIP